MKVKTGDRISFCKKLEGFGVVGEVTDICKSAVYIDLYRKRGFIELETSNFLGQIVFLKSDENKYGIELWDTTQSYQIENVWVQTWVKH